MFMFEDKSILITGGTGSLGQALAKKLLDFSVSEIRIFSRNEFKQIEMSETIDDPRVKFLIGDVRDLPRLNRAIEGVDFVFHAAALKHVPIVEHNPFEAIQTNIIGSQNVIDACLTNKVEKAICVGTDKAVSPLNTYGATKLLMEKLFVTALHYSNPKKYPTKFIALRYGNVMGSSGSVIPKFIDQIKNSSTVTITDKEMTRFSISMEEALDFILKSSILGQGSEVFVPKLRAYNIMDVKRALDEIIHPSQEEVVGIRPGEKLHETLINLDEINYTWELDGVYLLANPFFPMFSPENIHTIYPNATKIQLNESYSSDHVQKIPVDELKNIFQSSPILKSKIE